MRWYKVESHWRSGESAKQITEVEVDRFTESSVWIDGKRLAIQSNYEAYFPTLQAAIDHCDDFFQRKLESARTTMEIAEGQLAAWRKYLGGLTVTDDDSVH
jgi:hypothetical protein